MEDKKRNILAIGSHPDDVEMGCGATLLKHIERGDTVYVMVMTNGDRGGHTLNMGECLYSLEKLGIPKEQIIFAGFPDGYLADNQEVVNFIESKIKTLHIHRVYTHDPHDRHQDHRHCSYAASSAARKIPEILLFQGPSTNLPFNPHYFIEISDEHLKKKIEALESYQTQTAKGIVNTEWIRQLAAVHGILHNTHYCEAFSINHFLKKENGV